MRYYLFISLAFLFCFGFSAPVNSQIMGVSDGDLIVEFVPEIPKANELVVVSVKSYSLSLDSANFVWKINGKTIKTGTGEKNFNFTMGAVGERLTLDLSVNTAEGGTINKKYTFFPTSVDLIWQSSGYVPPFYKGKALFAHQNTISVIAIPHIPGINGAEMNPKNMIYTWKKNGSVIENASGFGRNVYTFESPIISRELDVSVEVTPQNGSGLGYASVKIKPIEPSILFYRKSPVYGIEFQKALVAEEQFGNSSEISLVASPFFFDFTPDEEFMNYKWAINGAPISDVSGTRNQIFRQKEGTSGTSRISLVIENTDKLLQYARNSINLTFKTNEN